MDDKDINKITRTIKEGFEEINKTIRLHNDRVEEDKEVELERGKAIFEFPANSHDVDLIQGRYKMVNALSSLSDYRREIDRYSVHGEIYIQNGKILSDEELNDYNRSQEDIEQTERYIKASDVVDKLDDILDGLWSLYGEY